MWYLEATQKTIYFALIEEVFVFVCNNFLIVVSALVVANIFLDSLTLALTKKYINSILHSAGILR